MFTETIICCDLDAAQLDLIADCVSNGGFVSDAAMRREILYTWNDWNDAGRDWSAVITVRMSHEDWMRVVSTMTATATNLREHHHLRVKAINIAAEIVESIG